MGKLGKTRKQSLRSQHKINVMVRQEDHILIGHKGLSFMDPATMTIVNKNFPHCQQTPGRYTTATRRFDVFDEHDGIYGDLYDRIYRADNGEFFFRGAYRWQPEAIQKDTDTPMLVFTSFKVFEK